MNQLTTWSFSKLLSWESCPMRVKLRYIDKIPEPPQDPKTSPLERGNRIHNSFEAFVKGDAKALDKNEARCLDDFLPMLERLQELYACGMATAEEDWTFDADWELCKKEQHWAWIKLDYSVQDERAGNIVVGDYKSGKSAYKTIDHLQQTQLYAGAAALKFEWADTIVTEIPYVDEGHIKSFTYSRDQALSFVGRFQIRADRMLADRAFKPNPNKVTCRWCSYSPRGNGACPVGV